MVTEYVPKLEDERLQKVVWVWLAVRVTPAVAHVIPSPCGALPVNVTVPAKLKRLVTWIFIGTDVCPTFRLVLDGMIVKSPTWTLVPAE